MNAQEIARHWANRITIEFGEYKDLMKIAQLLLNGYGEEVYKLNKHLLTQSITAIPGKPIKLYFLKEMAHDLHQVYAEQYT